MYEQEKLYLLRGGLKEIGQRRSAHLELPALSPLPKQRPFYRVNQLEELFAAAKILELFSKVPQHIAHRNFDANQRSAFSLGVSLRYGFSVGEILPFKTKRTFQPADLRIQLRGTRKNSFRPAPKQLFPYTLLPFLLGQPEGAKFRGAQAPV